MLRNEDKRSSSLQGLVPLEALRATGPVAATVAPEASPSSPGAEKDDGLADHVGWALLTVGASRHPFSPPQDAPIGPIGLGTVIVLVTRILFSFEGCSHAALRRGNLDRVRS